MIKSRDRAKFDNLLEPKLEQAEAGELAGRLEDIRSGTRGSSGQMEKAASRYKQVQKYPKTYPR